VSRPLCHLVFLTAENNMVISYNRAEGTQRGEFMGMPPSDKTFKVMNADICRFDDEGKIAEHWGVSDMMGMQ